MATDVLNEWQRVDLDIHTTLTCLAINWKLWLIGLSTLLQHNPSTVVYTWPECLDRTGSLADSARAKTSEVTLRGVQTKVLNIVLSLALY
jgi:hypothetical protein